MTASSLGSDFDVLAGIVAGSGKDGAALYGCRMEKKLVMTPEVAEALRAVIAERLPVEQWVPGRRRTLIHSIYFDTPSFELYWRNVTSETAMSLKLRLRSYADIQAIDQPDPARFLEAKVSATAPSGLRFKHKARMALKEDQWVGILAGDSRVRIKPKSGRKFWRPLLDFMATHDVGPRLTVSYVREAFVDPDGLLRITFDEDYRASVIAPGAVTPLDGPDGRLGDARIVEIKFVEAMPAWLTEALVELGLPPNGQSFSKFKTAVPLLYPIAPQASHAAQ